MQLMQRGSRTVITVLLIATALAGTYIKFRHLAPPDVATAALDENFDAGVLQGDAINIGFVPCQWGWCLPPGGEGVLHYIVPGTSYRKPIVDIESWFYMPPRGSNRLSISVDGGRTYEVVSEKRELVHEHLEIRARTGVPVVLKFEARNEDDQIRLIIDKLTAAYRWGLGPRDLWTVSLLWGLAPAFLVEAPLFGVAAGGVFAIGAVSRLETLTYRAGQPLDPDAITYLIYAERIDLFSPTGFYSGRFGEREPVHVLFISVFSRIASKLLPRLAGHNEIQIRLLSVSLSILSIVLVMWAAKRVFGPWQALVAGFLMATAVPLHLESVRGLRLEGEIVLFIVYLMAAFAGAKRASAAHALLIGVLGALLALMRSTYLPVVLMLGLLSIWRLRSTKRQFAKLVAVASLVTIVTVAPHRYGLYRVTGDPFYDTAMYARWNANFEFAGKPGFPTPAELQTSGYVGPRLTYWDYMFRLHTPGELVEGTLRGYLKLFRRMDLRVQPAAWQNWLFQGAALLGIMVAMIDVRWRWIAIAFILIEFPAAFLYDRKLVEPYRHTFAGFPLLLLAVCAVVTKISDFFARTLASRYPGTGSPRALIIAREKWRAFR